MIIVSLIVEEFVALRRPYFSPHQHRALAWAVDLAEEVVSDHYRFSETFWKKRGRCEFKTLIDLGPEEVSDEALAQIVKCVGPAAISHRHREFFRICLQDHHIKAARQRADLDLGALLAYVITHELVHVVRFARHDQLFEAPREARWAEELKVHDLTCRLLTPLKLRGGDKIFDFATPRPGGVLLEMIGREASPGDGVSW